MWAKAWNTPSARLWMMPARRTVDRLKGRTVACGAADRQEDGLAEPPEAGHRQVESLVSVKE